MSTKLYVGNLSFETSESDLKAAFEPSGHIVSCNLIMDKQTDQSRGFAFVEMSSADEAQQAISALDGSNLHGRDLKVNEAKPREDRGGGGGGGSRNRF